VGGGLAEGGIAVFAAGEGRKMKFSKRKMAIFSQLFSYNNQIFWDYLLLYSFLKLLPNPMTLK